MPILPYVWLDTLSLHVVMEQDAPHFAFLDALSYIKYAFLTAAITELQDLELTCDPGKKRVWPCLTL